jgi:hypothetical protein
VTATVLSGGYGHFDFELSHVKPSQNLAALERSVCLIVPPSAFLLDERVVVRLGILKIAATLEARNYEVNLLDLSGIENYLVPLADYVEDCKDIAVGATVTTPQAPAAFPYSLPESAQSP